jgi:hypothetical protein
MIYLFETMKAEQASRKVNAGRILLVTHGRAS